MKVKVRISIVNDNGEPYMGIGLVWLLERIKKFKSIRKAAIDMNMSYAKAHRILEELEENLGKKLLSKKVGGVEGGGATLTSFGEKFLNTYKEFQKKVENCAEEEFKSILHIITGNVL